MVLRNGIYRIGLVILLAWTIVISPAFAEGDCKLHKKEAKAGKKNNMPEQFWLRRSIIDPRAGFIPHSACFSPQVSTV